ncbi:MAG: GatB/YqeY domain-containing protein [Sphaerobacter thermophilus]|jgi:uncharacterized protein YqeY|uniref:GatB/YqeY domain-containing protein n=1 Tax=Sphaerobacter thermophilus (strain ATCC 49802 / DSM 20745 / KCCM 41009 / NCIMB 13125 / S 6022) TaxID=479434 RepID=D1C257_SPHTD|nr:GatB/YqeY domain-containing protein [Sphaerobacter thermophilus]ACZ38324.1 conserved hypothetical protein [Sphaerobacter thermophilus DSM 20745]PZN62373.1 MAG: GatB/YqeY domain-containing protein [Sphaerobacter thermophilus]
MSELATRLLDDLKAAVRASDTTRREVLRYLRAEVHNVEIERGRPLTDEEIVSVIQRQIKQRRDAIEQFAKGNRQDLVEAETRQIEILQEYLPPPLTREELLALAREVAGELGASGPKDMGRVMPVVRERVGARAEGRDIATAVREVLAAEGGSSAAS